MYKLKKKGAKVCIRHCETSDSELTPLEARDFDHRWKTGSDKI
jgi:hypothetical protein